MQSTLQIVLVVLLTTICGCSLRHNTQDGLHGDLDAAQHAIASQSVQARDRQSVQHLINMHETVIQHQPKNMQSLSALAQLYTLMGAAYTPDRAEKRHYYKAAMASAESIMMLNPGFKSRVASGESVWDACIALSASESDGLGWWSTAMLYYYREGVADLFKIFNYRLVARSKKMMDQLDTVNPSWENGTNYFNLAIYYHALPEFAGGDKAISQEYMAKAEVSGQGRLLIPWGKAKYFYLEQGNMEAFNQEIRWILSQNIEIDNGEYYAWRVYFRDQAQALVKEI